VTTPAGEPFPDPGSDGSAAEVADAFFAALAAQDFAGVATVFSDDIHLRALLPAALREWDGQEGVEAAFTRWFGDTEAFEVVDTEVDVIGARLSLRWRVRLRAERVGPGWRVVEQQAYADLDGGRLSTLALVCTGYLAEATDG